MDELTEAETKSANNTETAAKSAKPAGKRSSGKAKKTSASKSGTATTRKRKTPAKAAAKTTTKTTTKTKVVYEKTAAIDISEQQRLDMIAQAAYFKAEQRGFTGGDPTADWLAAESEIDALLASTPGRQAHA